MAATGFVAFSASGPARSNDRFLLNCVACHGVQLEGVEGLGPSLARSSFVGRQSVQELVAFLKAGRMPDDPASVSGRSMPGFAWLTEADLVDIATYVKGQNRL